MRHKKLFNAMLTGIILLHGLPASGQEMTPLTGTPPTVRDAWYDMNGDGKMEYLEVGNSTETGDGQWQTTLTWHDLEGNVAGEFQILLCTNERDLQLITDLNRDGQPDVVVGSTLCVSDGTDSYRSVNALGTFYNGSHTFTPIDINRDGRTDLFYYGREDTGGMTYRPYILFQTETGDFIKKYMPVVTDAAELSGTEYKSGGSGMFSVNNTILSGAWLPEKGVSYASENSRMEVTDLNADSWPDLFSSRGTAFLSLPDGRYYTASMGTSIKACEINGDGITDYVLFDSETGDVSLRRSSASGYTTEQLANNFNLTDVHICDLDNDGTEDILLTIDKTRQTTYAFLIFLRNQGDGTFKTSEQGLEGEYTFHEVVHPDGTPVLTAIKEETDGQGALAHNLYLISWDGNFNLTERRLLPDGYWPANPENPFMTDLNGDNRLDLLITNNNIYYALFTPEEATATAIPAPAAPTYAVDAAAGLLRMEWQAPARTAGLTYEVRIGTTPGGGDIVGAQANADGSRRSPGEGHAGGSTYQTFNAGSWPEGTYYLSVQAISPDGTGSPWSTATAFDNRLMSGEFIASTNEMSTIDTLRVQPLHVRSGSTYSYALQPDGHVASQEADGSARIVFESYGLKTVTLSADGHTFTQHVRVNPFRTETGEDGYSGSVFDLNQDGWPEGYETKLYSNTQGTFKELMKSFNTVLNASHGGFITDFNLDGLPDIYGNYLKVNGEQKRFLLNDGSMDFHAYEGDVCLNTPSNPIGQYDYLVPFGDIDNDGRVDFIKNGLMYKNTESGVWEQKLLAENAGVSPISVADFNRDGWLDIVATYSGSQYRQRLYLNLGGWQFEPHELPAQSGSLQLRGVADVNGDGQPDLIYEDFGQKKVYANLCDADLSFTERIALPGVPAIDLNNDGRPEYGSHTDEDSLIFQSPDGTLTYVTNNTGFGLSDFSTTFQNAFIGNICSASGPVSYLDVDGDGTPDYSASARIRSTFRNTAPTVPQNVYASQTADGLTIYWDGATDQETPSHSLRYNVSVKKKGATGEGAYLISPLNATDNRAQTGETGYMHYRTATRLTIPTTALVAGQTYEIQVQAVDPWNAHSDFSPVCEFTAQAMSVLSLPGKGRVSWPIPFETTIVGSPQLDTDGGVTDGNTIRWSTSGLKTVTLTVDGIVSRAQIEILDLPGMGISLPQQVLPGVPVTATLPAYLLQSDVTFDILRDEGVQFIHEPGRAEATFIFPEKDGTYDLNVKATNDVFGTLYQSTRVEVTGSGYRPALTQIGTDPATGLNRIAWDNTALLPAPLQPGTVRVYRETNVSDRYELLAEVPYADGSYVDATSTPALQAQRYRITLAADGGFESQSSAVHAGSHLMVNRAAGHNINLSWTPYEGRDVAQYVILSGPSPDRLTELTAVSGHTLSYTHARSSDAATYYALSVRFDAPQKRATGDGGNADRSNVVCSTDAFDVTMAQSLVITSDETELTLDSRQPQVHLHATLLPLGTTLKRVQWSVIEGEALADVSQDGTVTLLDNTTGGNVTVEAAATDGSGISETVTLTAAAYTDIAPTAADAEVNVRIAAGTLHIEGISKTTTVRLFNLQGITVLQKETDVDLHIPTGGLKGIYILQVGRTTKKLLIP